MAGKLEFTTSNDGGFFPRLQKAFCEGARGVVDQSDQADKRRLMAAAEGYSVRTFCKACVPDGGEWPMPQPTTLSGAWTGGGTDTITLTLSGAAGPNGGTVSISALFVDGSEIAVSPIAILSDANANAAAQSIAVELDGLQDAGATITLNAAVLDNTVSVIATGSNENIFNDAPLFAYEDTP